MIQFGFDQATSQRLLSNYNQFIGLHTSMNTRITNWLDSTGADLILRGIKSILGTEQMGMTMDAKYAERKLENPFLVRIAGKAALQPGILSGALYYGMEARVDALGILVYVKNARAGTRARTFQRTADPAEYLSRLRESEGKPRKQMTDKQAQGLRNVRVANINEYAGILNERTHFMMKGFKVIEREFVAKFEAMLVDELSNALGG